MYSNALCHKRRQHQIRTRAYWFGSNGESQKQGQAIPIALCCKVSLSSKKGVISNPLEENAKLYELRYNVCLLCKRGNHTTVVSRFTQFVLKCINSLAVARRWRSLQRVCKIDVVRHGNFSGKYTIGSIVRLVAGNWFWMDFTSPWRTNVFFANSLLSFVKELC